VLGILERARTINEKRITTRELGQHLRECGYTKRRLQKNYSYTDGSGAHTVPLVGFAYETCDARDACIAGLDVNSESVEQLRVVVSRYFGLGAPVVFACRQKELQWWSSTTQGAELKEQLPAQKVPKFFAEHCKEFAPGSIYRAKTLGRLDQQYQLDFVDVGLMPLFEQRMGDHLSRLIERTCGAILDELGKAQVNEALGQWLFQSAFRLLAARILRDKEVSGFLNLDLNDASETLRRVHEHYNTQQPREDITQRQEKGLKSAGKLLEEVGSLRHLTVESLAHVYENTLITKEIREALAIHATPPYLVDYIVWQLAPWIEEISQDNRVVLEPTCGHAPFLVSAARLFREIIDEPDLKKRHQYLKDRLLGIEMDSFAREIALLSLTLADVPNPNGWQIVSTDVYRGEVLSNIASKATILLCNPPWQDFTNADRATYAAKGEELRYSNKAAEILARTLPHMPPGSVFGVILPRGFLNSVNAVPLRKLLVEDVEIREICLLPDNVFLSADHESTIILGRKRVSRRVSGKTRYVRVRERTLKDFRDRYSAPTELIAEARFRKSDAYDLRVPELEKVWNFCQGYSCLRDVLQEAGKGFEYKARSELGPKVQTVSEKKFPGAAKGYAKFDKKIRLTETPKSYWMSLDDQLMRRAGHGNPGTPQVLVNSAPVSRGPWRLKALIDKKGHPVTSSFIVVRPKTREWSLDVLWGILNSPVSNAFAYCHGTKRLVGVQTILTIPIPNISANELSHLSDLVRSYFELVCPTGRVLDTEIDKAEAERRLLSIDAEVMRLYDLPPKLERQVLDLFAGEERQGVDLQFERYFPPNFESWIPLHEYLSEEYQRSTVSFVRKWVEEVRSPEIVKVFEAATQAFEED
jgi:hypothetical protein